MLDRSFIVRLFTIDQSLEVPLNVYLTSRTFYERFVKDAVYEINGDVQYLVDSVIDEKDTGVILLEEDKAFYTGKNNRKLLPITVHQGFISYFNPEEHYDKFDVISYGGKIFSRLDAGKGIWRPEEWVEVESGHQIPALTVYDSIDFETEPFEMKYGVFFYGDRLEYAEEPFDPDTVEEEKPEIITDTTSFWDEMILHDNLRLFRDDGSTSPDED
ncbi:hypothetical protein SM033_00042 [Vibrio phage vB_VpaM_sm033]|nr:hypothetical protein SM033_00042 [Vibrio phage vB_VpaM_sm033]